MSLFDNNAPAPLRATAALALSLALCCGTGAHAQQAGAAAAAAEDDAIIETPYWTRAKEGWFWQKDPPPAPKVVPVKPPAAPEAKASAPMTDEDRDLAALADFKARLERALNAATQNPSETNVTRFLELWAQARHRASVFGDTAQALAVRMPWIDSTMNGGRPSQPTAMRAFDSIQMQDRDQLLREMAQTHGLYFFFRRNCAYCHVQAPMLKQFQEKYGFTVYAVSLDGGGLAEFPNAVRDNGLADRVADAMGVPSQHFVVPAVVLAKPSTREVVPVGFGAMTMDEMADRVAMVVRVRDNGAGRSSRSAAAALLGRDVPDADTTLDVGPSALRSPDAGGAR